MIERKPTSNGLLPLVFTLGGVLLALGLSFCGPMMATADDINVVATVIDSTPSATPTDYVKLPIGSSNSTQQTVVVQLTGLEPYSFVQVFAQSTPVLIASGFADKFGVFKAKALLPANLDPGEHTITASIQKLGQSEPVLVPLEHFAVTAGGTIAKKGSGGGQNSGGAGGGANNNGNGGGGFTATPIPTSSPLPSDSYSSVGGVLLVGGASADSQPSWSVSGEKANVTISLMNTYKRTYAVTTRMTIQNIFGGEVASTGKSTQTEIRPGQKILLIGHSTGGIGQWGFYTASVLVSPPSRIDGLNLIPLTRQTSFFVLPIWPSTILALIVLIPVLQKILMSIFPNLRAMGIGSIGSEQKDS